MRISSPARIEGAIVASIDLAAVEADELRAVKSCVGVLEDGYRVEVYVRNKDQRMFVKVRPPGSRSGRFFQAVSFSLDGRSAPGP